MATTNGMTMKVTMVTVMTVAMVTTRIPARWRTMNLTPPGLPYPKEAKPSWKLLLTFRLKYKDWKRYIAKYSKPESKRTTCPSISPVVAATLPPAAIRHDKTAFCLQQMYMEAVAPLAALLENTDDDNFTIKEAISMVQSAIQLLGDAT